MHLFFKDSEMNRKFRRTAFIRNRIIWLQYKCFTVAPLLTKSVSYVKINATVRLHLQTRVCCLLCWWSSVVPVLGWRVRGETPPLCPPHWPPTHFWWPSRPCRPTFLKQHRIWISITGHETGDGRLFIPTSIVARTPSLRRKYCRNWAVQDMARSLKASVSPWNSSRMDSESFSCTSLTASGTEKLDSACSMSPVCYSVTSNASYAITLAFTVTHYFFILRYTHTHTVYYVNKNFDFGCH